jgi:predicted nucleotidyltransferase
MKRVEVISQFQANSGAESIYLYGSTAWDEAGPVSDVDIFVDRNQAHYFSCIERTELGFLLSDLLDTDVDLFTRTGLHPALSKAIEQSAVRVL